MILVCDSGWWGGGQGVLPGHMGVLMGARRESAVLFHIQTDRQVILDLGRTNWPVSPTRVNQECWGRGDRDGRMDGRTDRQTNEDAR